MGNWLHTYVYVSSSDRIGVRTSSLQTWIQFPITSLIWPWLNHLNSCQLENKSQIRSVAQSCPTLRPHESQHARPPCPSPTPGVHRLMSIESVMPSSHLILCLPLLLLPPIPPSIRVFSNESTLLMRWPKYWSFSFSIIPSKEIPGLICFRMDWLDLLAVQGTLRSLLLLHRLLEQGSPLSLNSITL